MSRLFLLPLLACLALAGCLTRPVAVPPPALGAVGDGYLGLALRDGDDGRVLVSWILPGPLEGHGMVANKLSRGDILLQLDGQPVTSAKAFTAAIKLRRSGEVVTLLVLRTGGDPDAAVPTPGKEERQETLQVTLARRSEWTGPLHAENPAAAPLPAITPGLTALETYLLKQLDEQKLREPVDKLVALFAETQTERAGFHALSRVNYTFHQPYRLPELARAITDPLAALGKDPRQALVQGALNLDVAPPALAETLDLRVPAPALAAVAAALSAAALHHEQAFAALSPARRAALPAVLDGYLTTLSPFEGDAQALAQAMRASTQVDFAALFQAAGDLAGLLPKSELPAADAPAPAPLKRLPRALRGAVTGPVLAVLETPQGWLVYGGPEANTYDLSRLAAVIDVGGDDTYRYSQPNAPALQVVVDLAGNDTYAAKVGGPAAATLGVNFLVDYAGNDSYQGELRSVGSALLGVAVLLDHAGNDTYQGTSWCLASGFYGLGAILDLAGSDTYWSHHASQGIGGPRGCGLLYDRAGADLYRANGPTASAYGTPAVYYGLSQGVAFGVRGVDTGGIGILHDAQGNDRYEAGEFSQGGGYFWGVGILDDRGGNDFYYGNRYGQGFGCHQATGVLLDHAGNDTYWAMTAASQGAAWDIGMGLLLDYQGDDTYRADGLSQGGAAMQGIAWLIDLAGQDHYTAPNHATHGQSGNNSYHYLESKCLSWSLLLDAGGATDYYSTERPNNSVQTPGKWNEQKPEESFQYGLFIDLATPLELK